MTSEAARTAGRRTSEPHPGPPGEESLAGATLLIVDNRVEYFVSHRLALARAARRAGASVHVTTLTEGDAGPVTDAGLTFHPITRRRRSSNPLHEALLIGRLVRLIRRIRPDVLQLVTLRSLLYGGLAARLAGSPPTVHAVTGLGYLFTDDRPRVRALRTLVLGLLPVATGQPHRRFVFQNRDDLELFAEAGVCDPEQARIIPGSGVDVEVFRPTPEPDGVPTVLFAGRMLRHKGVPELAEATGLLDDRGIEVRVVLAGDADRDNPASVSREQLEAWSQRENLDWVGYRDDMESLFREAAVVCLPSRYREGVPKTLLEAAASGRPVVTADQPGCRDAVIDGETGLLLDTVTGPEIADALAHVLGDPERRRRMGRRARELAEEKFSLASVISSTLTVYRELLEEQLPRARKTA